MKEPYKNLHWHEHKVIPHAYPLTDKEKLELAEEMSNAKLEMSRLESALADIKKDYKEQIDAVSGILGKAALKYKSGLADPVDVECDIYQDFESEEMVFVRSEDNVEIARRPMLDSEKRPTLFEIIETGKIHNFPE